MKNFEQNIINNGKERKEKPDILYISTQTPEIKEFTPRRGNYRDKDEGPVIFSTPDKALASAFLVKDHNDRWMKIGYFNDVPIVLIRANRDEFIKNDAGGVMYTVASDKFDFDPDKGMGEKEWTSHEPVESLSETRYISALDTMIENGVQVYFADDETFAQIKTSKVHGLDIISKLTSENVSRGKNIKSII